VFAPEQAIAAFGGDPDNFNFPRWSLDFSLMRVYENGKPARTPDYLRWRAEGPKAGDPVFVPGHPGSTSRLLTLEQLKFNRSVTFPQYIARNSELRGRMIEWGKTGDEPQRIVQENLLGLENSLKVYRGLQSALLDDRLMDFKTTRERELRERVKGDAKLAQQTGSAWDEVAKAQARYREIYDRYLYLESGTGFNTDLFVYARALVRSAAERAKPNEQRLREYADSNLSKLSAGLLAAAPIYPEFETLTFAFSLDKMREVLGPDDELVRRVLGKDSPDSLAARLVSGAKLADPAVRKALWDGGAAAIEASQDPMIGLARARSTRTKCRRASSPARRKSPRRASPPSARTSIPTRRSRCASATATCAAGQRRVSPSSRSRSCRACMNARPARRRSACRNAGSTRAASSTPTRRSIS
jgi:hypothetical protein